MKGVYDMKKNICNNKVFLISVVLIVSTILWAPISIISANRIKMGFPLHFIWYYDYSGIPMNRLKIFELNNLMKIDFRIVSFLLDIAIVYFILLVIKKSIANIKKKHVS